MLSEHKIKLYDREGRTSASDTESVLDLLGLLVGMDSHSLGDYP